ncbi:MAG TPA: pyridoxamine 5'-phosphate oxidase family protein [Patescibacteria group bacterium]|nr:pyridoxamine 5'-phosphate oxidase family protein [Patescibacteria group bacterium]
MVSAEVQRDFMEFLHSTQQVAVLATVDQHGEPMAATVYFLVDEQFNVYFLTKTFSRKYANLEKNDHVALVIGTENNPVTAQIQGRAEKLVTPEYGEWEQKFLHAFFKNEFVAPLFQLSPEKNDIVIYRVKPTWIRWLDLRREKNKVDNTFVQILP